MRIPYTETRHRRCSRGNANLVRSICSVHKDSDMCVGHLYVDIPGWARHQLDTDFLGLEGLEDSERDVKIGEEDVEDAYGEGPGRLV